MTAVIRYRAARAYFQASYTWSHTIDNQSEPLAGDFYDLLFTAGSSPFNGQPATFTAQFDPNADRGQSDFDQRHNLAFLSTWSLPGPPEYRKAWSRAFGGWKVAELASLRSGLPYTVYAPATISPGIPELFHNRAQLVDPAILYTFNSNADGGRWLFNPDAFARPTPGQIGNTGRNAFAGPGMLNLDLSLSKTFGASWLGEAGRLTVRADAYNVLNHANLNNPVSTLETAGVGIGTYGRLGRETGFPAQTPFRETARQIQFRLKIQF
jgi:hypothetical protein